MEQVMKAMPAAVSPAIDILNQPREDALADWELQNKGLKEAIGAESTLALAKQREAQAGYTGERADIERDKLAISRMTAEEKVRVSRLKTMTDRQLQDLVQSGRISLADANNAAAMRRVEAQQAGANYRVGQQQAGANYRVGQQQAGANYRVGQQQAGADRRSSAQIAAANTRNEANIRSREEIAKGKGGTKSEYNQRLEAQRRAAEFFSQAPEYEAMVTFDERGYPVIREDVDPMDADILYDAIYGDPGQDVNLPAPPQAPTRPGAAPIAPAPTAPVTPTAPVAPAPTAPAPKPATAPAPKKQAGPPEPTGPPPQGYVYIEDINGKFIGQVKNDANLSRLNTSKYRVRR
jgi:hypothetical protein